VSGQQNGAESIPTMVFRHEKDLYRGNGKPGLTTRMQQAEDCLDIHTEQIRDTKRMFWAIIVLLLTLLGGVVTDIVEKAVTHGQASLITTDSFTAAK